MGKLKWRTWKCLSKFFLKQNISFMDLKDFERHTSPCIHGQNKFHIYILLQGRVIYITSMESAFHPIQVGAWEDYKSYLLLLLPARLLVQQQRLGQVLTAPAIPARVRVQSARNGALRSTLFRSMLAPMILRDLLRGGYSMLRSACGFW